MSGPISKISQQEITMAAATAAVKKVGGAATAAKSTNAKPATAAGGVEKPKPVGLVPFDIKTGTYTKDGAVVSAYDTESEKLVAAPENFDRKKNKPLARGDFSDEAAFKDFRALQLEQFIAGLTANAKKYREEAANLRKFGDPEKRKALKKLETIGKQYVALQEALGQDGAQDMPSLEDIIKQIQANNAAKAAAAPAAAPQA